MPVQLHMRRTLSNLPQTLVPGGYVLRTMMHSDMDSWASLLDRNGELGRWDLDRARPLFAPGSPMPLAGSFLVSREGAAVATAQLHLHTGADDAYAPLPELGWVSVLPEHRGLHLGRTETVEPSLARLAAIRSTERQLDEMHQTLEACYGQVDRGDVAAHLAGGRRFHQLVGEAAGNVALTRFVVQNEERTDMYILTHSSDLAACAWRPSVDEHNAILGAIARREPEEAARLVIYHSQSIRHRLVHLFRPMDAD